MRTMILRAAILPTVVLAAAVLLPDTGRTEAVNGSGQTVLAECNGGGDGASLTGSGNLVVFHGPCPALLVAGSANVVEVDLLPGGTIVITGTANHILYAPVEPPPVIEAPGAGNLVGPGSNGAASAALAPALPELPPPAADLTTPLRLRPTGPPVRSCWTARRRIWRRIAADGMC